MPVPLIAAGVAAVGAIGGAVIGSSAQKKAAKQANAVQQETTTQQTALGRESLALQDKLASQSLALQDKLSGQSLGLNTDIYNTNYNLLSPYVSRGNVASTSYNALLGLPEAPTMTSPLMRPGGGTYSANGPVAPPPAPAAALPPAALPPAALPPTAAPPAAMPAPTIQQHAQEAIAAGADPMAVQARLAQMGGGNREPFHSQFSRA